MDVKVYKAYVPDSMSSLPLARFGPRLFASLDQFLHHVELHEPGILRQLVSNLRTLTECEAGDRSQARDEAIFGTLTEGCSFARLYPGLFAAHYSWLTALLDIPQIAWAQDGTAKLRQSNFIRARYLPHLLKLNLLVELLGREEAVALMRQFLDWSIMQSPSRPDSPNDLTELRKRQVTFNLQEEGMNWVAATISEHQYLNKVTTCRIQKVLSEHGDPELLDVVACHPDFAMFRKTNENFRLTRTQTLMSGGAYCDTCYHDIRFVSDFCHPSRAVFDQLGADGIASFLCDC